MKKNGMECATTNQKENGTSKPIKWLKYSHRVVILHFETSALSRKTVGRKQGRNTMHFTADSANIELVMRHHSLNKSAQYLRRSVELEKRLFWNGQMNMPISEQNEMLSQQLNPQEVGSLTRSSPRTKRSCGKLLAWTRQKGSRWWLQKNNFALWAKEQDSSEQSRKGM